MPRRERLRQRKIIPKERKQQKKLLKQSLDHMTVCQKELAGAKTLASRKAEEEKEVGSNKEHAPVTKESIEHIVQSLKLLETVKCGKTDEEAQENGKRQRLDNFDIQAAIQTCSKLMLSMQESASNNTGLPNQVAAKESNTTGTNKMEE